MEQGTPHLSTRALAGIAARRTFDEIRCRARKRLLQMHYDSKVGHIGGNLSALDCLLVLFHEVLTTEDVFILSKGHAAGALYVALWSAGKLSDEEMQTFHRDNTRLAGHPAPRSHPAIPFATGSLGHGLSLAVGMALAKKLLGLSGRCFCLTSDGEWNEGSMWEALWFSMHHGLSNLTFLVDANGLQGFGSTRAVANLEPLGAKFESFGALVSEIDGHDPLELRQALQAESHLPHAIVAHTVKGKGVSFMENQMEWHYLPLSAEQFARAVAEIESGAFSHA